VEYNKIIMKKCAKKLIAEGVKIFDPGRLDIRGELICGKNVTIDINVIIEGRVELCDNVSIGANCILIDSYIGEDSSIKPFSMIEGAIIGKNTFVGPYGRIRQGTTLGDDVQIGNFVEIKNSFVESNGRINHLSFIGDANLDEGVTIGAGVVTCNHDGIKINKTIIKKHAYIGSGCNLIAPIEIGENATIAAGSTLNIDAPRNKLTIARSKQITKGYWKNFKSSDFSIEKS